MKLSAAVLIAILSAIALSCASVYDYHYRTSTDTSPDIETIATRLSRVLEPHGFKRLTLSNDDLIHHRIPQVGDTGYLYCPKASDPVVFLREGHGRTTVHLYACQGEVRIVALADSWAPDELESANEILSREFGDELIHGEVMLVHRHRIALE